MANVLEWKLGKTKLVLTYEKMALNVSEGRFSRQGLAGAEPTEEACSWPTDDAILRNAALHSNGQMGK